MEALAMKVIFPKGDPNGIKIIELTGWDGKSFIVPRTEIKALKEREEAHGSGIYFLFGEDKETGGSLVYIGQSGDCLERLTRHDTEKDFWNEAIFFLNPPDRNYLESITTRFAREANRYIIKNGNQPQEEYQDEFDKIRNEKYLDGIKKILSTFGYKVFEKISDSYIDNSFYYLKSSDGADARARILEDGQMLVLKDSKARVRETEAFTGWAFAARRQFIESGILIYVDSSESFVFTEDVVFNTPSAAAATIKGAPINGWTAWKDEQGNTLDDNLRK